MAHLAVLADSGITTDDPLARWHWERAAERAAFLRPAHTVHLGSLTRGGAAEPQALHAAAECLQDWPSAIRSLPGPHDLMTPGASALPAPGALLRFRRLIGADCWTQRVGAWWLVGLNAALFGTDSEAERDQWAWLLTWAAQTHRRDIVLCMNRPLPRTPLEGLSDPQSCIPGDAAQRLTQGALGERLFAVIAGSLPPASREDGLRHDRLPAGNGWQVIEQLVVGPSTVGMGWVLLGDGRLELGFQRFDRLPSGEPFPATAVVD